MSIWEYSAIKKSIDTEEYITRDEGKTPLGEYSDSSNKIFVKREDLNPTGSWKDRGSAYKLTKLLSENQYEAVIASSGNAAISLLSYVKELKEFKLHIVVSENVDDHKKEILESLINNTNHQIYFDKKAKRKAARISGTHSIPNIRSATDEDILKGYWSLGMELAPIVRKYRDKPIYLFMAASSGTTAVGMVQGMQLALEESIKLPKIIISQTSSTHPLVNNSAENNETSLASAIVDKSMLRKPQLQKIIDQTGGKALLISNSQLNDALSFWGAKTGNDMSYTSLLPVAGYMSLREEIKDSICIFITSGR